MFQLKLALRSLARTPLITTIAVGSLALGMGANAAIFSVFEQMILRSLPVPQPERLVNLVSPGPKPGSQSTNRAGDIEAVFSYPMFRDLEKGQESFTGIAAHRVFSANLAYAGETESGEGMLVSGSYFQVLGLQPVEGRLFTPDDDRSPGGHPLAVLSHSYWSSRFNANPAAVGEVLVVNGQPLTIVGVAPEGFEGTTLGQDLQVFVPLTQQATMIPGLDGFEDRRRYWLYLFARLAPGVAREQAQVSLNGLYQSLVQEVEVPLQEGISERTLAEFRSRELLLEPGHQGQSNLHETFKAPMLLLFAVTAFVLLITCANITNLLLTKAANRATEIAVQRSIGASRGKLVGQFLLEALVLTVGGAILGLLVARWTLVLIAAILPSGGGPAFEYHLGGAAWVLLGVLALATSLVGLVPALHSTRGDLVTALKSQSGKGLTRSAQRFRAGLTMLQIALSMMLLISAGLFTRSLYNVSRVDLGLDVETIAAFSLSPELNGYEPARSRALFERVEEELRALPGVRHATASMVPLLSGSNWGSNVTVQGFDAGPDTDTNSRWNEIGTDFFRTLGIPLMAGREFTTGDAQGTPRVAIVNQAFAEKFQMGDDVVGKRMAIGSSDELDIEIVGLVTDASYSEVKQEVPPLFYLPYRQDEQLGSITFYTRAGGDPAQLLPSLRGVVSRLEPNLPVEDLKTLDLQMRESIFLDRMLTTLSTSFAVLATLLAALGLYGVLAYAVAQRKREIGLRMALGADASWVRRLIFRQVGWLTLPGAAVGLLAALGLGYVARSLLFELEGHDPATFVIAIVALALVAFLAGLFPALRASRIHPMEALREE